MKPLKLKEYLNELNRMVKLNPSLLELPLVTARDDEGNGYNHVFYTAGGVVMDDLMDIEDPDETDRPANAVLLN